MNATTITVVGNLGDTPELKLTPNGTATARMRVAVTERRRDDAGEWVDGDTSWHTVIAWGALAEQAAASLSKGAKVIVHGRLSERSFETKDGEARTVWEVTADEIGTALRHSTEKAPANTDRVRPQSTGKPRTGNRYAGTRG